MTRRVVYSERGYLRGAVEEDRVWRVRVKSRMMWSCPEGWSMDKAAIERAKDFGAIEAVLTDASVHQSWTTTVQTWLEHGIKNYLTNTDQLLLPIKYFDVRYVL